MSILENQLIYWGDLRALVTQKHWIAPGQDRVCHNVSLISSHSALLKTLRSPHEDHKKTCDPYEPMEFPLPPSIP